MDYICNNLVNLLKNQQMLAQIYREQKHEHYLKKNRAEKLRARIARNIHPSKWKKDKAV
jgi:hypothetical protein